MYTIVIHGHLGDTVALVSRTEELDAMNLMYTVIPLDSSLSPIIEGNADLEQALAKILGVHIDKSLVGL